jgi:hypothetical protein
MKKETENSSKTNVGHCQLCGERAELQKSHIWSKFIYKATVSDQEKGGSFIDLAKGDKNNRQYTLPLFCLTCDRDRIGPGESEATKIVRAFLSGSKVEVSYDRRFLEFAVSISLRTVLFHLNENSRFFSNEHRERLKPAVRRWKDFLLGRTDSLRPYSQHVFCVMTDSQIAWHRAAGGQIGMDEDIVNSQMGPLYIFGLIDRKRLTRKDVTILAASEVQGAGQLTRIPEMVGGIHLTNNMLTRLKVDMQKMKNRVQQMDVS